MNVNDLIRELGKISAAGHGEMPIAFWDMETSDYVEIGAVDFEQDQQPDESFKTLVLVS